MMAECIKSSKNEENLFSTRVLDQHFTLMNDMTPNAHDKYSTQS